MSSQEPKQQERSSQSSSFSGPFFASIAFVGILVLMFQHCSSNMSNFTAQPVVAPNHQSNIEGGNGDGYEGKIYVSQGECESKPKHISSKIAFDSAKQLASLLRERCDDLKTLRRVDITEFEWLEQSYGSFRYRGEIFLPEARVGAAAEEGVLEQIQPATPQLETFDVGNPDACINGLCFCGAVGVLYSCAATDKVPDEYCKKKGYTKASTWSCANLGWIPICARVDGTGCWYNQNPGNSVCTSITCVK